MLILTKEVANMVRCATSRMHAIEPMLLSDGNFALPEEVLLDRAHARFAEYLRANSTIVPDRSIIRVPEGGMVEPGVVTYERDEVKAQRYAYMSTWPEGQVVVLADPVDTPVRGP